MRSKISYFWVMLLLWLAFGASDASAQSFKEANQLYKESKYDQAIQAYEKISQAGFESGNLYYNLGNSYFKKGELGRALLNYERSRLFIPQDSDVRSNYDFVRTLLNIPSPFSADQWPARWVDRLFDNAGINSLTLAVSALWAGLFLSLAARLFMPGIKQYAFPAAAVLAAVLVICVVGLSRKINYYEHGAIVTNAEVEAKFEPSQGATTYFKLTEGSSVLVLERSAGWTKISRPDQKIGWIPAASISAIKE